MASGPVKCHSPFEGALERLSLGRAAGTILKAAAALFAPKGYDRTSIRAVAGAYP